MGANFGALADRIHGLKVEVIKEGNHSSHVGKPDYVSLKCCHEVLEWATPSDCVAVATLCKSC